MSEELQSEEVNDNYDYVEEVEQDNDVEVNESAEASESEPADLATDSDAEHEQKTESQIAQDKVQEVINKKHWEAKENERKYLAAQKELEQYKAQQQQAAPEIPPMPDPFEDDYEQKLRQRDEAMRTRITWEAQQDYVTQQQKHTQEQEQQTKAKELYDKQMTYTKRAKDLGISGEDLQKAGEVIAHYGLNDGLVMEILDDNDGALITKHLAANPMEIEALNGMSPYAAARYIETMRPKLAALKPKKTNASTPATRLDGKGTDPDSKKYKHVQGTFT
jgi:hypothetical protein